MMQALELAGSIDDQGELKLEKKLMGHRQSKVKVIPLFEDDEPGKEYFYSIANNPSFEFLNEPEEDIYSNNDGIPIQ